MAKKKITELELSLLHLQQNVEIPEISLNIHPVVQKTVEEASNLFRNLNKCIFFEPCFEFFLINFSSTY
jgi:hypothetical protein